MHKDRLAVFAKFARDLAALSKCRERKVAAIITDKDMTQVYSIGLNGGPKGLVDCMCKIDGKYGCVHAEINALVKCQSADKDKVMIVTLSPCKQCAAAIINAPGSFYAVYYIEQWKDMTGIRLLHEAGIRCELIGELLAENL
jgi:deoxycytidylate deaminase